MKHNRKYKLLKDLPDGAIVGDIYVDNGYGKYTNQRMDASKSPVIEHNSYFSWQVETSTDFFEEVNTVEKGYQDLIEKCKNSPYFFATNYLTINGKPFSTMLSEEEFNKQFLSLSNPEPSSKKEEGWEILSVIGKSTGFIYKKRQGEFFYKEGYLDIKLSQVLDGNVVSGCEIHSVLRKSDNTVFTVGDETTIGVIKRFEVSEELMYWWNEHTWYYLSQAIKAPTNTVEDKPLFVTEDGEEIFDENDLLWVVNTAWVLFPKKAAQKMLWDEDVTLEGCYKYFSTRYSAEKYLIMNKPQFSISEINKIYPAPLHSPLHNEFEKQLINVAKSKTNNQ